MAEALRNYVRVLKESTRLECLIESHLDNVRGALTLLERWNDDECWAINTRGIGWSDLPTCHAVFELVQNWRNTQHQLTILESRLSEDERAELMAY